MMTTIGFHFILMTVIEFIKEFKIPQKVLADKLCLNYTTFRKKLNNAGNQFSENEKEQLEDAVRDYVNELNENVQKYLSKLA